MPASRRVRIAALTIFALVPAALAEAAGVPASGTYTGSVEQRGSGSTGNVDDDYLVRMTFSSRGSSITYPDLGCRGRLEPNGFSGGRRVYREVITRGGCDRGGVWKVDVFSGRRIQATWRVSTKKYVVSGTLTR